MQVNIRVWRSLVSRLNGVQEASSSNLDTRTKKPWNSLNSTVFLLLLHFLLWHVIHNKENLLSIVCWTLASFALEYITKVVWIVKAKGIAYGADRLPFFD